MTTAMTTTVPHVLTLHDRCDRCSAAARVRAVLRTGGELFFCGHHARVYAPRLRDIGAALTSGSTDFWFLSAWFLSAPPC
jgi:hypothetical protein